MQGKTTMFLPLSSTDKCIQLFSTFCNPCDVRAYELKNLGVILTFQNQICQISSSENKQ